MIDLKKGVPKRLDLDGELHRSEVPRCPMPVRALSAEVLDGLIDLLILVNY
jgi:hypothetical protein